MLERQRKRGYGRCKLVPPCFSSTNECDQRKTESVVGVDESSRGDEMERGTYDHVGGALKSCTWSGGCRVEEPCWLEMYNFD